MRRPAHPLALLALIASGCDLPRDPEGTLDRVRGGVLRVGLVEQEPWVRDAEGEPTGAEVTLVRELAAELGATPEFHPGGETELFERLEKFELDLVVGGITDATPYAKHVGLTLHHTKREEAGTTRSYVFATPPGENDWLLTLDRFLYRQRGRAEELAREEASR